MIVWKSELSTCFSRYAKLCLKYSLDPFTLEPKPLNYDNNKKKLRIISAESAVTLLSLQVDSLKCWQQPRLERWICSPFNVYYKFTMPTTCMLL